MRLLSRARSRNRTTIKLWTRRFIVRASREPATIFLRSASPTPIWKNWSTPVINGFVSAPESLRVELPPKANTPVIWLLRQPNRALKEAKLDPKDIDMIIVGTVTPDEIMPNTACHLQKKLGARDCMAIDISAACTGFVYGISIADQFIKTGVYKNVLVVGADVLHRIVNYKDRDTCILFGDGCGACVLSRAKEDEDSDILAQDLRADGYIGDLFVLPAGGSAMPITHKVLDEGLHFVRMKGREIFKHAVRTMSDCCSSVLKSTTMPAERSQLGHSPSSELAHHRSGRQTLWNSDGQSRGRNRGHGQHLGRNRPDCYGSRHPRRPHQARPIHFAYRFWSWHHQRRRFTQVLKSMWSALFPGQGSQQSGMGKFLFDEFKLAREIFEEASDVLSLDFKKLCFDGSEGGLGSHRKHAAMSFDRFDGHVSRVHKSR